MKYMKGKKRDKICYVFFPQKGHFYLIQLESACRRSIYHALIDIIDVVDFTKKELPFARLMAEETEITVAIYR